MWIFNTPENYTEMIEKISKSVSFILFFMLYIFCQINANFSNLLKTFSFGAIYNFAGIELNLAIIYLPLAMGILEHMFKIHDVISRMLRIRKQYDRKVIVYGILSATGICYDKVISNAQVGKIMSFAFYKYASSTSPVIDKHYITLALNEWCWFWIVLDTAVLVLCVSIPFLIINYNIRNFIFIICIHCFMAILLFLIYKQTKVYTKKEIQAILSDSDRKEKIKEEINNALFNS